MKYIFSLLCYIIVFNSHAQWISRSGLPQNENSTTSLRTFPCGGTTIYEENFNTLQAGEIPADWQILD